MIKMKGLSQKEVEQRIKKYGLNEIKEISKTSGLKIILRQIKNNFVIYLLLLAAIISFLVGKRITGYTIFVVIFLVIVIGFFQEYRAEKAIKALQSMLRPVSIVIRNGKETEISSSEIVPGDIILLRSGGKIPADCVILEEQELLVNESVLTGESKEVSKSAAKIKDSRKENNMLFMGTFVINGKCTAEVVYTGMKTKFGHISKMISTAEKELPLQKKINKITKHMAIIAIIASVLTGLFILSRSSLVVSDNLYVDILILVIALAVSAFPEGFPVVLITTLASGAYRMAKKNAIVNRMSIIETLGETTVICSDKTGTITKGEMTVKKIFTDNKIIEVSGVGYESIGDFMYKNKKLDTKEEKVLKKLIESSVMCNDARIERMEELKQFYSLGSPTEVSLLIMAAKAEIFQEDLNVERLKEIPFSSERKMMSALCKTSSGKHSCSKGAPEILLTKCKYIQRKDGVFRLTEREKERILETNKEMTSETYRTLAIAYKKIEKTDKEELEKDLVFLGIVGIKDPPREEVAEAIKLCKRAGIKVKMITGDNKETAIAIGRQIGISGGVMEGSEFDKISDSELKKKIDTIAIFSRVKPEHKIRIVKALKDKGEIVTMTGDGVNDAPALKEAHIGVAMGKNGTDVSRSVADLTLKDDNFATIVNAIKEGRTIFKNIRKFVSYQLSCNVAELSVLFIGVLLAPFLGWKIPLLLALHILFMNLVTDNLPAITLGFNPSSEDTMEEKPRKDARILTKNFWHVLIFTGALMAFFVLLVFFVSFNILDKTIEYARTTALVALITLEIAAAFEFRSFRKGVLNRSPVVNKYLVYASLISIAATIIIIYTPVRAIFETVPLGIMDWVIALSCSFILLIIFDILKKINNRRNFIELEHSF